MKNKFATIGIIIATIILAGIAIFTAMKLYQTKDTAIAPNVPSSRPAAAGICGGIAGTLCPAGEQCVYANGTTVAPSADATGTCTAANAKTACSLAFSLATPTPTATPTASPVPLCNSTCTIDSNCPSGMACYKPNGQTAGNCRNTQCLTATNCTCATSTPTPTASPTATPVITATPTPTVTASPTPVITASPNPQCNYACTSNSNCPSGLICYIASGQTAGNCRNTQCLSETDCTCAVATITPAPKSTDTPTLPSAGTGWPTIVGTGFGILVIIGSMLIAL